MKFYPYKKACALLVTGALTTGAAVPALAAEAKTEAPQNAEESKTKAMTLKEIQELVVKNNRLKTTLTLNQEKVIAGLSAIDDGLKDLKDSQDKAAHARRDASASASQGKDAITDTLGKLNDAGIKNPPTNFGQASQAASSPVQSKPQAAWKPLWIMLPIDSAIRWRISRRS